MFKNSQRCNVRFKAKFPRLKRLKERRTETKRAWYSTADAEGNVQIHPR